MLWVHDLNGLAEAILTSTLNIGFYEDLTKNFFQLSSDIILFFCIHDLVECILSLLLTLLLTRMEKVLLRILG